MATFPAVLAAMPFMTAKFPFDWRRDLSLLILVARVHAVLAVHPYLPINTLQQLVAYAKSHPRKITFGSSGAGTFTHLVIELLMMQAKIELVHAPYRRIERVHMSIASPHHAAFPRRQFIMPDV